MMGCFRMSVELVGASESPPDVFCLLFEASFELEVLDEEEVFPAESLVTESFIFGSILYSDSSRRLVLATQSISQFVWTINTLGEMLSQFSFFISCALVMTFDSRTMCVSSSGKGPMR